MAKGLWLAIEWQLRRALPPDRVGPVLVDLFEDHAERQRQTGTFRASLWLIRESRSLGVAYRRRDRAPRPTPRGLLDRLRSDVLHAWRSARRHRGYVGLSLGTLTLAVGANLLVFTVANALWLRPRPVADPNRVVMVLLQTGNAGSGDTSAFSETGIDVDLRASNAFEGVAGQVQTSGLFSEFLPHLSFESVGHPLETLGVTWQYFSVLGVPVRGRDFGRDDDRLGAQPTAIISDRLWKSAFAGRPDILNTIVPATPLPVRIIGIAPDGFQGARLGERADVWVPSNVVPAIGSTPHPTRPGVSLTAIARLRRGITPADAERLIAQARPGRGRPMGGTRVIPLARVFGSPDHRTIVMADGTLGSILVATAALLLLGGCATLMALVLVHYECRRQEFGVRLALGASRSQMIRLLLWELGGVTIVGSTGAVLLAALSLKALPALSLPSGVDLSRLDLTIDWRVAFAGIAIAGATLLGGAALPIVRSTRSNVATSLVVARATSPVSSMRLRWCALCLHVSATLMILVVAGLFVRTVVYAFADGAGFDTTRTVFIDMQVGSRFAGFDEDPEPKRLARASASRRLIEGLRGLSGVERVSIGNAPIGPDRDWELQSDRVLSVGTRQYAGRIGWSSVGADYLAALGIPVLVGRALTDADVTSVGPGATIVTKSLADTLWPGQSPIGRQFTYYSQEHTVVGLVPDIAYGSLESGRHGVVFIPNTVDLAARSAQLGLVLRTNDPRGLVEGARQLVTAAFPDAVRLDVLTGQEIVTRNVARERLGAWFFSGFGAVGLTLGVFGVFGLVAYLAESRRHELGVRMALGAMPGDLMRVTVATGLTPVVVGIAAGLMGAVLVTRATTSFLVGVSPLDPFTYVGAGVLVLAIAAAAGVMAAARIRHLSPVDALRAE